MGDTGNIELGKRMFCQMEETTTAGVGGESDVLAMSLEEVDSPTAHDYPLAAPAPMMLSNDQEAKMQFQAENGACKHHSKKARRVSFDAHSTVASVELTINNLDDDDGFELLPDARNAIDGPQHLQKSAFEFKANEVSGICRSASGSSQESMESAGSGASGSSASTIETSRIATKTCDGPKVCNWMYERLVIEYFEKKAVSAAAAVKALFPFADICAMRELLVRCHEVNSMIQSQGRFALLPSTVQLSGFMLPHLRRMTGFVKATVTAMEEDEAICVPVNPMASPLAAMCGPAEAARCNPDWIGQQQAAANNNNNQTVQMCI